MECGQSKSQRIARRVFRDLPRQRQINVKRYGERLDEAVLVRGHRQLFQTLDHVGSNFYVLLAPKVAKFGALGDSQKRESLARRGDKEKRRMEGAERPPSKYRGRQSRIGATLVRMDGAGH